MIAGLPMAVWITLTRPFN